VTRTFPVTGFHAWEMVSVSLRVTIPAADRSPDRTPLAPDAGGRLFVNGRLAATPKFIGAEAAGACVAGAKRKAVDPGGWFRACDGAATAGTANPDETTAERTRPDRRDRAAAMLRPNCCAPQ